eukprot:1817772-Rhodomonas_salina.2
MVKIGSRVKAGWSACLLHRPAQVKGQKVSGQKVKGHGKIKGEVHLLTSTLTTWYQHTPRQYQRYDPVCVAAYATSAPQIQSSVRRHIQEFTNYWQYCT